MAIARESNPVTLFNAWMEEARKMDLREPTAMALATSDAVGMPSVRMVLLKGVDDRGFTFYTNLESLKAQQVLANPQAGLCFYWAPLGKQVRVQGCVERVTDEEADAYFASRPRQSQIGAWASKQSRVLTEVLELEREVAKYALKFGIGKVPRPPFWSGFRLKHDHIEFWQEKPFRLHERLVYHRIASGWETEWLYP